MISCLVKLSLFFYSENASSWSWMMATTTSLTTTKMTSPMTTRKGFLSWHRDLVWRAAANPTTCRILLCTRSTSISTWSKFSSTVPPWWPSSDNVARDAASCCCCCCRSPRHVRHTCNRDTQDGLCSRDYLEPLCHENVCRTCHTWNVEGFLL